MGKDLSQALVPATESLTESFFYLIPFQISFEISFLQHTWVKTASLSSGSSKKKNFKFNLPGSDQQQCVNMHSLDLAFHYSTHFFLLLLFIYFILFIFFLFVFVRTNLSSIHKHTVNHSYTQNAQTQSMSKFSTAKVVPEILDLFLSSFFFLRISRSRPFPFLL